jgi:glycosyltransferase involved in cell wall biosynthesis
MLKSLFSKPYSRLYLIGDNADWAIDEEAKALLKTAHSLGLKPKKIKRAWLNVPQIVHYASQFSLLDNKIYKSRHRISLDYFHGKPEDGESYRKCFEALVSHPEIYRVRVSNSNMKKALISYGVPEKKIRLIPIGVDLPLFSSTTTERRKAAREKLGIPKEAMVIGSFQKDGVGWGEGNEPKTIKGPDVFIKVVEKLNKEIPHLWVLLSGPSRGFVKNELDRLRINYTHIYPKEYNEVGKLYDALDLYLITSREEGGPKACLESMAKGIPLVTTAVGQCADLIEDGKNAMMAPVDDEELLVQKSLQVIREANLRNSLIKEGFETARTNSLESQLPIWQKYFHEFQQ